MPRVTRQHQNENPDSSSAVNRKKVLLGMALNQLGGNENRNVQHANAKRKAGGLHDDNKMPKKRAALGEITNAFAKTRSHAQNGLSKMMSKSSLKSSKTSSSQPAVSTTSSNSSSTSSSQETNKPRKTAPIKKPPRAGRVTRRSKDLHQDDDEEDRHLAAARSLPASQEAAIAPAASLDLTDHFASQNAEIDLSDADTPEESLCGSADEGDDEAEASDHDMPSEQEGVPEGVTDFDNDNAGDPNQVSEYAMEVFQYYKNREAQFRVPDYMKVVQKEVTPHMRAVLVDWLVEVQESFELNHETLYTAVKMLDLYLSQVCVKKEDLQLIGATACLIAAKIDERLPPTLSDFVCVCDDAYNETDLKRREIEMIRIVDFDVGYPLSYRFLRRYARVCGFTMSTMTFGRYVLELALMEYGLNVDTSESMLAAAALALTAIVHELPTEQWKPNLEYFSGYKTSECVVLFKKLHAMLLKLPHSHSARKTIRTKYSHSVFHNVALKKIPSVLTLE